MNLKEDFYTGCGLILFLFIAGVKLGMANEFMLLIISLFLLKREVVSRNKNEH